MDTTLLLALGAGMLATVNPCGFAMLPAYLTLVITGRGESPAGKPISRAVLASAAMTSGFVLVFGIFGVLIVPLAASVQRYLPVATVLIGLGLLALGLVMLAGKEPRVLLPKPKRGAPDQRLTSMFGYGLAYAAASLSCTLGPFLALVGTTLRGDGVFLGVAAFLAYAAGMGLVVTALAVVVALLGDTAAGRTRRILPYVTRIGGGLLVLVGGFVGYYGIYELRLLGGAETGDPVIDAAGAVQTVLVDTVDQAGPVPFLVALSVLIGAGVFLRRARTRRHTGDDG
ncbi:MAG: cytochrome c biogenesis protein CcdA [Kutzneria sp.]|nr:cytochrome c biogenesis protein CcdA [Kutzneria sp.]